MEQDIQREIDAALARIDAAFETPAQKWLRSTTAILKQQEIDNNDNHD